MASNEENNMSVNNTDLAHGAHPSPEQGMCAMEWAAYLAGEPHSDHPSCVSPVVRRYMVALNDRLPDRERQRLKPFVLRSLGTADDGRDEERRRALTEFVLRDSLPFWLEAAGMTVEADRVRDLPDLGADSRVVLREVRQAAWRVRDAKLGTWSERRARMRKLIEAELVKRGKPVAVAAAAAAADADADSVYDAAYEAARARYARVFEDAFPGRVDAALVLLDGLLPAVPVVVPVAGRAGVVAGWVA